MEAKKKKKYAKPYLAGEPLFEAVALACCKTTSTCTAGTGKTRTGCTRAKT